MTDQVDNQNQTPASPESPTPPANPPAPVAAPPAAQAPQRLPDDHPLVTAFEAQKTKNTALQAQIDQIPATVASNLRQHLIKVHGIDEATANTLITGTTPESVMSQIQAVTGLTATPPAPGAPLLDTTQSEEQPPAPAPKRRWGQTGNRAPSTTAREEGIAEARRRGHIKNTKE